MPGKHACIPAGCSERKTAATAWQLAKHRMQRSLQARRPAEGARAPAAAGSRQRRHEHARLLRRRRQAPPTGSLDAMGMRTVRRTRCHACKLGELCIFHQVLAENFQIEQYALAADELALLVISKLQPTRAMQCTWSSKQQTAKCPKLYGSQRHLLPAFMTLAPSTCKLLPGKGTRLGRISACLPQPQHGHAGRAARG